MQVNAKDILVDLINDEYTGEKYILMAVRDREPNPNYELRYIVTKLYKSEIVELRDALTEYITKMKEPK